MNESIKKLLSWIITKPVWVRILSLVVIMILCIIVLFSANSCGVTRAIVRNSADSTTTSITITTNNPTSVTASPDVQLNTNSHE